MTLAVAITPDPKAIRKAFVARLIAKGIAGGNVVSTRGTEFPADDVPAVNVFSPGSDSKSISHHSSFAKVERIVCAATVVVDTSKALDDMDEAIGDAIDDMEQAIKVAIFSYRDLMTSIRKWQGASVQKGQSGAGLDLRGHVAVEFQMLLDEAYTYENPIASDGALSVLDITVKPGIAGSPTITIRPDLT